METLTKDKQTEQAQLEFDGSFDYKTKYPAEYYEKYIETFEPNQKKRYFYRFVKRSFDIVVSLIMLVLFSPVMLGIAIAIKCDSKGAIIFKGERMGRNGKTFKCYKFRSMRTDAPKDRATSLFDDSIQYQTRVGRFLRKTSLDELPQLICVLFGTMSFIGYRPLVLTEENCNDMRRRLGVFSARPGISGYAQVCGRDDVYYKNKAIMDAYYVKNATLWFDLKLMFQTVAVVLNRKGNNSEKQAEAEKPVERAPRT